MPGPVPDKGAPSAAAIARLQTLIPRAQRRERIQAQRLLQRLTKDRRGRPIAIPAALPDLLADSVARRQAWQARRPHLNYDEQLPITGKRREIITAIQKHSVVIVAGDTGSGKTTQIPKFCLEAGRGVDGVIGCTQPRRIAAMAVARRLAQEMGEEPGAGVGYQIRFQENLSPDTRIKFMTDGILLAEAQQDRFLNRYDTLIVDEAHERSLNIDFVLGLLQRVLQRRRDLRLVITSATIDTAKFAAAFDNAPVIEVSGRMFPVTVRYLPPRVLLAGRDEDDITLPETVVMAVRLVLKESRAGDILVFMPTEQDIRDTRDLLEGHHFSRLVVLPLYARLTAAEQTRIFESVPGRKIILATNIAETSLTIPGIRYVIDTGLARISQYLPRTRTTALPIIPISRSSADQRKGRCGRVADGICLRLYAEEDYAERPLYNRPEILRANLAEVILRMLALKIGDVREFPFIDRPDNKSIQDGFDLLLELGAIRPGDVKSPSGIFALTRRGRLMARLPVDPRLAAMLLAAHQRQCLGDMLVIAAALSIQDARERPADKAREADLKQALFKDSWSDFSVLLNIWQRTQAIRRTAGSSALKRFCREYFISHKRLREWWDVHRQLEEVLQENNITSSSATPGSSPLEDHCDGCSDPPAGCQAKAPGPGRDLWGPRYAALHQAILSGFLSNIAVQQEKNMYKATKGRDVMLFPGSTLFNRSGTWIVAAEMVETSRLFARTVANIDVAWLEELGGDLCRRVYLDPHWDVHQDAVMADEQVSLFGLIIVPRRNIHYRRVDARAASDLFIRGALVQGRWKHDPPFMQHNRSVLEQVRDMEHRLRRCDLLVSEETLFDFYRRRLEDDITDTRALKHLIRRRDGDGFLRMQLDDALNYDPAREELALYPQQITLGATAFNCAYHFAPGQATDGLTLRVPVSRTAALPRAAVDWLVPGMLGEKITCLLKGLPKAWRKRLVPLSDTVRIILQEIPRGAEPLPTALSRFVQQRFGVDIPAAVWQQVPLPDHLKMRIAVTDHQDRELHSGRNTAVLNRPATITLPPDLLVRTRAQWEKQALRQWDFGDLPALVSLTDQHRHTWEVYPALVLNEQEPGRVDLRLLPDLPTARRVHPAGVAGLAEIILARDVKVVKQTIHLPPSADGSARRFGGRAKLADAIYRSVLKRTLARDIRTQADFAAHLTGAIQRLHQAARELTAACLPVIQACYNATASWDELLRRTPANAPLQQLITALARELNRLVPSHFMELYVCHRLLELPRYIRAMELRARRAALEPEKEEARARLLQPYINALEQLLEELPRGVSAAKKDVVEQYFWMVEEYKVSLFAQELRTALPISAKRLDRTLDELKKMI